MVISSTITAQVGNVHAPVPLSRTRPRSVPVYTPDSFSGSPSPSRLHSRSSRRKIKYVEDKPPFINFASEYINPYRPLSPVAVHPHSRCRRHHRSKSRNSKRRLNKQKTRDHPIESIPIDEVSKYSENNPSPNLDESHRSIEINPSHPNAFDKKFCRNRQMIIDNPFYREKTTSWKPASINDLSTLIKELTLDKNVIDRVWLIYYWLSQNIQYDIDADFTNRNRFQRAEDVFRTGKSTCEGYASIFKILCDNLNIPCEKIRGFAKDFHFKIDQPVFSQPNHTWNAVKLYHNYWYLIDAAWGTGYIDNNHKYKKDLKTHYFLIHPEHMIYNHFPEDSRWQLLSKPITMEEFIRLPHIHSYYFIYNLSIISPFYSSIISYNTKECYAEALIQAPDDIQLTCSIKDDIRGTSLTHYDATRQAWQCLFSPHKTGFHTLIIFAKPMSATKDLFKNVIELGVTVKSRDLGKKKALPMTFEKFTEHKCQLFSPLDGILKRGTKAMIRCRIPHAYSARLSLDGIWLDEVPLKNEMFKQQINVPEEEVIVYAKFNNKRNSKTYDGLIRYTVEK